MTVTIAIPSRQENQDPGFASSVNTPSLNQWIPASHLKTGEKLKTSDGALAIADGGSVPSVHAGWMWDLTVPGNNDHDFYVAVDTVADILVHNANTPCEGAAGVDPVPDPEPVYKPSGAPDRNSPWYVSYRDPEGNIQTVGNEDGVHAEVRIQQMEPGTQMSRPFGWRTVDGSVGPQWVPGTVCAGCQIYPPDLFAPGTEGAPGGPWGVKP